MVTPKRVKMHEHMAKRSVNSIFNQGFRMKNAISWIATFVMISFLGPNTLRPPAVWKSLRYFPWALACELNNY